MFPAQNLRSPPASAMLGGSGSIPPCNNTFAERCFIVIICLKLFVHIQIEQDGDIYQMTLHYRHRVWNLSFGDLRQTRLVSVTEPPPPPKTPSPPHTHTTLHLYELQGKYILKLEQQSLSCHLLHHNTQKRFFFFHGYTD